MLLKERFQRRKPKPKDYTPFFYLGATTIGWLNREIPLCISYRTIRKSKRIPYVRVPWVLDSGGFSELSMFGRWTIGAREYAKQTQELMGLGRLRWAAIQDWMCEPYILSKTGGTVPLHQRKTVYSYLELRDMAPTVPWLPVLQGWTLDDYLRHIDLYNRLGVDLDYAGVGSVCKRQSSVEIHNILSRLHGEGLQLHGFGVKLRGLRLSQQHLYSADSSSWSILPQHSYQMFSECTHKSCKNCYRYARQWYRDLLGTLDR